MSAHPVLKPVHRLVCALFLAVGIGIEYKLPFEKWFYNIAERMVHHPVSVGRCRYISLHRFISLLSKIDFQTNPDLGSIFVTSKNKTQTGGMYEQVYQYFQSNVNTFFEA